MPSFVKYKKDIRFLSELVAFEKIIIHVFLKMESIVVCGFSIRVSKWFKKMKLDDWFPRFVFTWAKYSSWEYLLEMYLNKDICVLDESIYCLKSRLVEFNIVF